MSASMLEQRLTWKTRNGDVLPIHAMETSHIRNAIGWLEARAGALHFRKTLALWFQLPHPDSVSIHTLDSLEDVVNAHERKEPMVWLMEQPTYQALVTELLNRGETP